MHWELHTSRNPVFPNQDPGGHLGDGHLSASREKLRSTLPVPDIWFRVLSPGFQ